jgi:hypothetical protein
MLPCTSAPWHLRTPAPWHLCTERAVDAVEALPLEDQETLIDLVHRRLIERRRAEIARHAAETLQAVREGRAKYGTIEDLRRDLLAEPFDPSLRPGSVQAAELGADCAQGKAQD